MVLLFTLTVLSRYLYERNKSYEKSGVNWTGTPTFLLFCLGGLSFLAGLQACVRQLVYNKNILLRSWVDRMTDWHLRGPLFWLLICFLMCLQSEIHFSPRLNSYVLEKKYPIPSFLNYEVFFFSPMTDFHSPVTDSHSLKGSFYNCGEHRRSEAQPQEAGNCLDNLWRAVLRHPCQLWKSCLGHRKHPCCWFTEGTPCSHPS